MHSIINHWLGQLLLGQARHAATAIFSLFAAKDWLSGDQAQAGASALIVLITLAFSAWDKIQTHDTIKALVTDTPLPPAGDLVTAKEVATVHAGETPELPQQLSAVGVQS